MFINCPKCSKQLPTNLRYCTQCGTKLEHTPVYQQSESNNLKLTDICSNCSAPISSDYKFCRKCGAPVETHTKEKNVGKQDNLIDELKVIEKLYELKEKGIVSEEEFENKKKEILGS